MRRRFNIWKKATNIINTNMCSKKKNSLIPTKKLPLLNIKQEDFLRWQIFFVQKKIKISH
jgi:hypothetical protein